MALPSLTHGPGDFSPFVNIGAIAASDAQQRALAQQGIKSRETPAVMQIKQLFFLKKISTSLEKIEGILGKGLLLEQRNNSTQELTDIEARREAGDKKGGIAFEKIAGGVAKLGLKALAGSFLLGVFGGLMKWGERLKPILNSVLNGLDWIDTKFKNLGIIVEELTGSKRLGALVAMIPLVVAALAPLAAFKLPRMLMGAAIKGGYKATKAVAKGGYNLAKGAARMGSRPRATARLARMKLGRAGRVIGRGLGVAARAGRGVASVLPKFGAAAAGVGGIASKIFPITMIAGAIFGTIKGIVDGFKQDGIIGAIKGGFKGLIDWTVGGIIDLIADGLGWVMKKMGFEEIGEKIQEFSFSDMIIGLLDKGIEALKEAIWGIIQKLPEWAQKGLPEGLKAAVKPKSVQTREDQRTLVDIGLKESLGEKLSDDDLKRKAAAQARLKRNAPPPPPAKKAAPEGSSSGWSLPGAERRAANNAALQQRVAARNAGVPATVQSSGGNSIQNAGASMQSAATGVTYGKESSYSDYGNVAPAKPLSVSSKQGEDAVRAAAAQEGITDPTEVNALLAQVEHESGKYKYTAELGSRSYFDKYEGRKDLGNTQQGDGYRYRGRGFIQLTGRANYTAFARDTGIDVVNNPDILTSNPLMAAKVAIWYWKKRVKPKVTDFNDIKRVTKLVNGGYNGLNDRIAAFKRLSGGQPIGSNGVSGGSGGSIAAVASKPTPVAPPSASSGPAIAAASAASTPAALAATTSGGNTTNINAPSTTIASNGPDKAPSSNGAMNAVTPPEFAPMVV